MTQSTHPSVAVLGAGSWGTALAALIARHGHATTLWGRDPAVAAAVTIPSVLLPLWARPGPVSSRRYPLVLARFVVQAGVLLSLATFGVYLLFVSRTSDVRLAQLAVTYTLLYAGLALSVLVQPPRLRPPVRAGAAPARDWRATVLAATLALVGTLVPLVPLARRQYRIDFLPHPTDYLIVLGAVAGWALVLHLVWRAFPRVD